jgi:hypothetical protein
MTNLILIDSRVPGVDDILSSLTPNTESLVFDYSIDTFESIQSRIQKPYESVVIAQHNYGLPSFKLLATMERAHIYDVMNADPELESWNEFTEFLQWLKQNGATNVDFLACNLWSNSDWVYAIGKLRAKLELSIRASIDITGIDGNFVLESDNVDMIGIYFTSDILKYKYNFFTNSTPDEYNGQLGYTPIIFPASNPGYLPASAYNSIFGGISASFVQLTSDISNVAMVSMTKQAVAVLQTNGNVIAFGDPKYGGNSSPVSAQLTNITKIVSTSSWFTALRSDGRVFSWGGGQDRSGLDINSWTNTGDSTPLLSDVSNNLVNVVDIFSNTGGSFVLTASGGVYGWGTNPFGMANFAQIKSGIVKFISSDSHLVAINGSGVAYYFRGTSITSSATGSSNSNPIVNAYICNSAVIYIRTTASGTTQITSLNGGTLIYTIPAGVSIIRVESWNISYFLVLLSTNVLLNIVNYVATVINNVTDIATTQSSYAYLQNSAQNSSAVVVGGHSSFGGSLTDSTYGLPSGASLTNVRRLVSSIGAIGALKYDNTFVWWGQLTEPYVRVYSSVAFPTGFPTLYAAISSNIASVYGCQQGLAFTKTDGSIVSFGTIAWGGGVNATTPYGSKRVGKNVCFIPNYNGFIAVENTPTASGSLSQYVENSATDVTYYNNNPDVMALRGRKYSVMVGTTVMGTWVCPKDSFTYTFTNVVFTQGGNLTVSICDTPNNSTSYTVMGTFSAYIFPNPTPSAPTINSVTGGDRSITVEFTPGDNSTLARYEYALERINVLGSFIIASSTTSPITINGLTNGYNYKVVMRAVSSLGVNSSSSNTSSSVSPGTVPTAPVITGFQSGNRSTTVSWSTPNTNGSAITDVLYNVSGGTFVSGSFSSASTTNSSFTINGLTNGTKYDIRVIAVNSYGQSSPSSSSSVTPISVPEPPTVNSVVPGDSTAQISLTPGSTNGSTIIGYKYSLDGTNFQWVKENTSPIKIYGLTNGSNYNISLKSVGQCVGDSSAVALSSAVMPYKSPEPPVIQSIAVGNGSAVITFVDGSMNGLTLTGYKYSLNAITYFDISAVSNTITLTGLTNGTTYTVRMKSVSELVTSSASVSSSFTPYTNPSAPTITSVVPGNQTATVYITDGAANGSGSKQNYQYTLDGINSYWTSSSTSPIVISSGLVNGQSYNIRIATKTTMGMSEFSSQSAAFIPYTVPSAPTITSVVAANGSASLYFTDGSSNGRSITSYQYTVNGVEYPAVTGTSPLSITGLTNGTSYKVTLKSANLAGYSSASLESSSFMPFTVPGAPTITNLVPGANQVTVYVSPGNTNGSAITQYAYSLNGGNYVNTADASSTFVITGLINNNSYTLVVKAVNAAGTGAASATPSVFVPFIAPSAPTNVVVTPLNESAVITFTDGATNGEPIQYYLYSLSGDIDIPIRKRADGTLKIFGISNAVTYTVRLRAVNSRGASVYSSASNTFMPFGIPLVVPVITKILPGNACVYVYFSAADTNGSPLTKFVWTDGAKTYDVSGTTSPLTISGSTVVNKKAVSIQIASCNLVGTSPLTTAVSIIPGVPLETVITSVVSGPKKLLVYFDAPLDNGFAVSSYLYGFVDASGKTSAFVKGTSANTDSVSPLQVLNLKNGTPYNIKIVASNLNGNSNPSNALGNRIPCEAPAKVSVATVTPLIDGALVGFTLPLDNGTPLLKYKYALGNSTTYLDASGLALPLRIYGIPPNTPNTIKIIATNAVGDSIESAPSKEFKFIYLPPSQIKVTALTIAMNQLTIAFLPPTTNGAPITGYRYALDASGSAPGQYVDVSGTSLPLVITEGVLPNVIYNVRVVSKSAAGQSIASSPFAKPVSFMYLPPSQIKITGLAMAMNQLTVPFVAPTTNGAPITGYRYALDASGSAPGSYVDVSGTSLPLVITEGILPNVFYTVRVVSTSLAGQSVASTSTAKPVSFVYLPPLAPTIASIDSGNQSAVVNFTALPERGAPVTGYSYTLDASATTIYDLSSTVSPLTITGLTNDLSYNVRIAAITPVGRSAWSLPKPVTPVYKVPDKPIITAAVAGNGQLTVTFTAPAANGSPITGYKYTLNGGSKVEIATIVQGKTFVITGLTNGTVYNVQMCATNALGDSDLSILKAGTPKA